MPRLILRDDYVDEIVRTTQGQKTVRRYFEDSEDSILSTKSDMEHGHHGMRRMLSPIHQVIRLLNRLNMVNEEQYRILRGMYGALSIIMGFYLVYWTINNLVKQYENYQRMLAAGETAFYWLTPGGRIRIANALAISTMATASLYTGFTAGSNIRINLPPQTFFSECKTPDDLREIYQAMFIINRRAMSGGVY